MAEPVCPQCNTPRNEGDRFCPSCGFAFQAAEMQGLEWRPDRDEVSVPVSPSWALMLGVAGTGIALIILGFLRRRKPLELFNDRGAVHDAYRDEWESCQALGDMFSRADCVDELEFSIALSREWYLVNYIWVALGVGAIVSVIALLMIIASNQSRD